MENRVIVIQSEYGNWHMQFDSNSKKDSEALHELLCEVDPGDEYTIYFAMI